MLGRNRPTVREAWPEDAPSLASVRRGLALGRGLPVPTGEPDDDEYAECLAQVKGGSRRGGQ